MWWNIILFLLITSSYTEKLERYLSNSAFNIKSSNISVVRVLDVPYSIFSITNIVWFESSQAYFQFLIKYTPPRVHKNIVCLQAEYGNVLHIPYSPKSHFSLYRQKMFVGIRLYVVITELILCCERSLVTQNAFWSIHQASRSMNMQFREKCCWIEASSVANDLKVFIISLVYSHDKYLFNLHIVGCSLLDKWRSAYFYGVVVPGISHSKFLFANYLFIKIF